MSRDTAEYHIRRKGFKMHKISSFQVVKFTTGEAPDAIYNVVVTPAGQTCDCPAFTRPKYPPQYCKHMLLVGQWLKDGEPPMKVYHAPKLEAS